VSGRFLHVQTVLAAAVTVMLLLVVATCASASVKLTDYTVAPAEGRVGDVFTLRLQLDGMTTQIREIRALIDENDVLSSWTQIGRPEVRVRDEGRKTAEAILRLQALQPGRLLLPAVEITAVNGATTFTVITLDAEIPVSSTLTAANEEVTSAQVALIEIIPRWVFWLLYGLAGAVVGGLAAAIAFALVRWWRRTHAPQPKTLDEWALDQLQALETADLLERKRFKEFYTSLSDVIREYMGRLFAFDAMELTSSELLDRVADKPLDDEVRADLTKLLEESDLVKFAKYVPEIAECRRSLDRARRIIRRTAPLLKPPEGENPRREEA